MRPPRLTVILGMLLLIANAALADKVTSDYNHRVNFSKYKTFMWIEQPEPMEPFMKERIMKAVNLQLQARGFRLVKDGADLAVCANLASEEKHTWETYYTGGGGWGWGWGGGGWATTTERIYQVGTLTVDMFDADSQDLVWQGVATDKISSKPEKQTKKYAKQVEKMFMEFPTAPLIERETMLREVPGVRTAFVGTVPRS